MDEEDQQCCLFVTAHPDDECMFFTPLILQLVQQGLRVALLCLSTGNANGLGQLRAQELYHACSLLGVLREDVRVVDDSRLQDGMQQHWQPAVVAEHVAQAVQRLRPDRVYTFDEGGVSGHPNHLATCAGVLHWWAATPSSSSASSLPELWQLETVALPRKYAGPADAPLSWLLTALRRGRASWHANLRPQHAWRALLAHRSQMVWYRCLWMTFSRYMYVCTVVRRF